MPLLDRGNDRLDGGPVEAADALEGVRHLMLLLLQLALVGKHLPRGAGMSGPRLDAVGRRLEQLGDAGLPVPPLALDDARADAITGDRAVHEQDVAACPGHPAAAVRERLDHELELVPDSGACGCLCLAHRTYAGKPWT